MDEVGGERQVHLPLFIAGIALLITVVGGTIRIHDAGESCPDWPTCFGSWGFDSSPQQQESWWQENPDEIDSRGAQHRYSTFEIFIEWFHRLLVGIIAIPILLNVFITNKNRSQVGEKVRRLAIYSAILLLLQAVAGYATVKFDNADWSVALHLVLAVTFISVLLWQWLSWKRVIEPRWWVFSLTPELAESMKKVVGIMLIAVLILLILGAWVSSTAGGEYNQACGVGSEAWPLCQGELVPDVSQTPIIVQMAHRIAVLVVGGLLFWGSQRGWQESVEKSSALGRSITSAFFLWGINLLVGGLYLFTATEGFIEWLSLIHLMLAVASFIAIAVSAMLVEIAILAPAVGDEI